MGHKKRKLQKCNLCHTFSDLRHSHILPEFFYLTIYDKKHRAIVDSSDKTSKMRIEQKGIREYLLCERCEQRFSKYELFAAPIIKLIPELINEGTNHILEIPHIDYKIFKLFHMSLLWRASISNNFMFSKVNLGNDEERLRRMLLDENPGEVEEFACVMLVQRNPQIIHRLIMSPTTDFISNTPCFRFQTGSLFWYFTIDASRLTKNMLLITKENILRAYVAPWAEESYTYNVSKLLKHKYK